MTTTRPAGADIIRPLAPATAGPVRRGDLWSPVICWGTPRGRACAAGAPISSPKKWGERRARGSAPWIPPNGGSWRRWAVRTGQKPTAHCRPFSRQSYYRRCRAPGGTHRDYPASPDGRCAVPGAPAGPPGAWSGCGGPIPTAAVEFFVLVTVTFWRTVPAGPPRGGSRRSSGGAAPRPARWPARRPGRCPPARPRRRARRSCRRYTRS